MVNIHSAVKQLSKIKLNRRALLTNFTSFSFVVRMTRTSLFLLAGGQILARNLRNQFENRIEFRNIKQYLKTMDDAIACALVFTSFACNISK